MTGWSTEILNSASRASSSDSRNNSLFLAVILRIVWPPGLERAELEHSQIAFACRDILQDFTDAIFKDYLQGGEEMPTRWHKIERMRYT